MNSPTIHAPRDFDVLVSRDDVDKKMYVQQRFSSQGRPERGSTRHRGLSTLTNTIGHSLPGCLLVFICTGCG